MIDNRRIVYDAFMTYIVSAKMTPSRRIIFNGPCCVHNGQMKPDTRRRSGIVVDPDGSTNITCFNCDFRLTWKPGGYFNSKLERYFTWLGMPSEKIKWLSFRVNELRKDMLKEGHDFTFLPIVEQKIEFTTKKIPDGCLPIDIWAEEGCTDQKFIDALTYLESRGDDILLGGEYMWSPNPRHNDRIYLPFYWKEDLVGWTGRAIYETNTRRYMSEVQPGYIFNTEKLKEDWQFIFVTEGPFDAIAINGVAMLGDKVTKEQAGWLNRQGKTVVVVPDRVNQGGRLVDTALAEGWHVTFPSWDHGIKDAADAVKKYGKLYTVWSIIDAMTANRLEIGVKRQRFR